MKGVRVALVVQSFPARSETFIASKAAGLTLAGWDVHVVCQKYDAALFAELPAEIQSLLRGRVHQAWPHRPKWLAALLVPFALARCSLRQPITTFKYLARGGTLRELYLDTELICLAPRIVHFEFGTLAVGRIAVGRRLGAATVVSFRGFDLNFAGLDDPSYYNEVWSSATAFHTLGSDLWKRALKRGCPADRPHALIPPAIDSAFFEPARPKDAVAAGSAARPLRILSVGRLEWKKGYEYALAAIRSLRDRGLHCEYHIIGAGEFHTATAYARYEMGLTSEVSLLGACPRDRVKSEFEWADVMLHPAVSEGFGNAVMEAQAMSVPVVCTDADGLRENVRDGETGLVVSRRDPEGLANALERFARDPGLRARMGAAGRARVLANFKLTDQIAAFGALYELALSQPHVAGTGASRLSLENDGAR
jgi:colanic acid/amylovoran biosynthesis glycosyltransferase